MTLSEQKQALRDAVAQQTNTLEGRYLLDSDTGILLNLSRQPELADAQTIFCYISVGREPDTHALVERLLESGKTVAVPRCQKGGVMDACSIDGFSQLKPAPYGLLEPDENARIIHPADFELVIAPCVAADRKGGRLGHGAGYYDRFLAKTRCPVFCLCRGRLLQEEIPMDSYDRRVDLVVTEEGVFPSKPHNQGVNSTSVSPNQGIKNNF